MYELLQSFRIYNHLKYMKFCLVIFTKIIENNINIKIYFWFMRIIIIVVGLMIQNDNESTYPYSYEHKVLNSFGL